MTKAGSEPEKRQVYRLSELFRPGKATAQVGLFWLETGRFSLHGELFQALGRSAVHLMAGGGLM
jgi:hypothetical protein